MPIELFFSNRIEQLAVDLAERLYAGSEAARAPFVPIRLVVPNRNLGKWLQLRLARHLGVSMNIDYAFLDTVLWDLLVEMDACAASAPLPADQDIYALALMQVLERLPAGETVFDPIRAYLDGTGGAAAGNASGDTRRWQLAARLAHLFLEYELNRPDWIPAWRTDRFEGGPMAVCQGRLYRRALELCDRLEGTLGRPVRSLPHFARDVLQRRAVGAQGGSPATSRPLPVVNIFGLSQISSFHTTLIRRLLPLVGFRIFTLNPSEAFWEDVRTPREKRWEDGKKPRSDNANAQRPDAPQELDLTAGADSFLASDHPLLSLWGKPGRENIRRLCELGDYDFQAGFRPPDRPDALLGRLQESLRMADGEGFTERGPQDTSVQVVGCPGRLREVEAVHQRILDQLDTDPGLQLTDIAVLVPDMKAYKPLFDAVFQRSPQRLSYNLVDTLAETESHYGRGVLNLLALMNGRFTRAEVMGLMMNPLFLSRWSVDMEMVAVWAGWIEALNIYHSFDPAEKAAAGGVPGPRYTWQQGLRRLRLGRIMETEGTPEATFQGLLPYADLESGDAHLLEPFCLAVEDLHAQVVRLRRLAAEDPCWPQAFLATCAELFSIGPQSRGEAAVKDALETAFGALKPFAHFPEDGGRKHTAVSVDLLREFVAKHLRGLSTAHGEYLTGGVTLAALQPMRPIPFEIIYILGMEEGGGFPGRADNSSLDLRLKKRRRGDVSTPERNSYLFLEAILSARRQLVITYQCRDLQRDRDLMPCAPVHQLKRFIGARLLEGDDPFREQCVPLKGSDPAYLKQAETPPWAEPLTNANLLDRILALRTTDAWPPTAEAVPADLRERVASLTVEAPDTVTGLRSRPQTPVRVSIDELRRFLLSPIPATLARHLGVSDTRPPLETLLEENDEPFAAAFPTDFRIVRATLEAWLDACWQDPAHPPAVDALFRQIYDGHALRGEVPEGVYENLDRRRLRRHVADTAAGLAPLMETLGTAARRYARVIVGHTGSFRSSGEGADAGALQEAVHLPPAVLQTSAAGAEKEGAWPAVEISGELGRVWRDGAGAWHCLVLGGGQGRAPKRPNHDVIPALLGYLAARCAGAPELDLGTGGFNIHLVAREGVSRFTYRIRSEEAETYLRGLARRYLDVTHHRWLPFRVVTQGRLKVQELASDDIDALERERFRDVLVEAWDEAGDYLSSLARPLFDTHCLDEALWRVGLFFTNEEG